MADPWEFRQNDNRTVNSKRLFIIFCEDGSIEPAYFDSYRRNELQISVIGNSKQHHAQVDFATEYFRKNDLIEVDSQGFETLKIDEGAQVWCVFDRDKEPDDGKDTAFNDSIIAANSKGIQTAWSNDDFELWILLHFEDVDPNDPSNNHRKTFYERLTQILKENQPGEALFQNPRFDYYNSMKSRKNFLRYTYPLMIDKVGEALRRAEFLENYHRDPVVKPSHLQSPCTRVHWLVKELLK